MSSHKKVSLSEINQSIDTPNNNHFWQNLKAFLGPGALVAVGYMDPGNWITSVVGGASYKYSLLFVILISSLIAMQLQQMAGKLGIVTQMDLAQATAHHSPKWLRYSLWVILELALMATDLAEVLGSAIALNLLFKIPIMIAILLTVLDVFLLLLLMKFGFKKIEAIVTTLILTILAIFTYLVALSHPSFQGIVEGYLPNATLFESPLPGHESQLTLALGIVGATVMPHNLYLHSSLSQTRKINHKDKNDVRKAVRFMTWDSNLELSLAFVVNSLLLILGAALFFGHASEISAFSQMYNALQDSTIAGAIASSTLSTLFALAFISQWSEFDNYGYLDWTNRYGRFLAYEIASMVHSFGDSPLCLATCHDSCSSVWSSGKNLGSVIGLFTGLSFNRSSVFNLPFDLFNF